MKITQKLASLVFPSPRSNGKSSDAHRADLPPNEAHNNRCQFTFSDGRQCRNQTASLCLHHAPKKHHGHREEDLSDDSLAGLVAQCGDLTTATNINRALAQVFLLTAQGRISQKQAVAFGYLSQLLLQTVPGIRSEYVSVHGYAAWETHLKSLLSQNADDDPQPSGGEKAQPINEVVERQKAVSSRESPSHESHGNQELSGGQKVDQELSRVNKVTSLLAHKEAPSSPPSPDYTRIYRRSLDLLDRKSTIRRGSSSRANSVNEGSLSDPAKRPDYDSIFHRSLELLDRKFDTTPEGRREASALMSELEQINRALPKPRKNVQRSRCDRGPSRASPPPATREPGFCSSGRPAEALMSRQGGRPEAFSASPIPATSNPADNFVVPPSRRPESGSAHPRDQRQAPIPGFTLTRVGHSHDWYVPASWSKPRPDPYPSRQEQLNRKLRGNMSDRRWQHQNQCRAFWR